MPRDLKSRASSTGSTAALKHRLNMPVIGMEAEFNVWLDEKEINPEPYWKHPKAFIDAPLLTREKTSSHIPTGGAVYFDRGVIEVVTPVIEIAPGCTARVVRNLWEQIGFVKDQLTAWGKRTGHTVRLKAYSSHYNISFELRRREINEHRNIKKLALLLAYILPVPVMIVGGNRRSTGVGVRPRGDRLEVTVDFTPDPGLMVALATLIVGIVREVISWPSYELDLLDKLPIPTVKGVIPGKHTTRKGWLTKDFHYPQSPYTSDIDAKIWTARDGRTMSLREMAHQTACFFKKSIRKHGDPFSFRLLFAILEGLAPSMLELKDRPLAYEDVGRLCRWGMVIHELRSAERERRLMPVRKWIFNDGTIEEFIAAREAERAKMHDKPVVADSKTDIEQAKRRPAAVARPRAATQPRVSAASASLSGRTLARRKRDASGSLLPSRKSDYIDRRRGSGDVTSAKDRRARERRTRNYATPFPDRRLTRSAYELVFLKLVSGGRLNINGETYTPIGMKGWYHAIFRRDADGSERLITIDQLLKKMNDWV